MARLLIVHHSPSPGTDTLRRAVLDGCRHPELGEVEVVERPALGATVSDVLDADGYVLGTPANLGYMSGALKHFFDTIFYPCLDVTAGRPYGLWVHGNNDVDGAVESVGRVVTGLRWRAVADPVRCLNEPTAQDRSACAELGATVAASLL
jgi:multimeric flavodoxin WrbA